MAEWIQNSRLSGVLRYQYKSIGKLALWTLLVVFAAKALALLTPYIIGDPYPFDGIRADFAVVFFAAFVIGTLTAGRGSRFLLRFGTARTSVWLGNVVVLLFGMAALLAGTFVLNMLIGAALFPLSSLSPQGFSMSAALYGQELQSGLKDLPQLLLYTLEWTAMFYLYGCMLRRFRVLTISLSIGIPAVFILLMLIPAVREAIAVVNGQNQGQIMVLGLRWIQILQDILRFVEEHWDSVQLTAGIVSLPLSYLIMRGTKQP